MTATVNGVIFYTEHSKSGQCRAYPDFQIQTLDPDDSSI